MMSYVKPGVVKKGNDLSVKHTRARRSTETLRATEGTTSLDKPFYWSKGGLSAIYNDTAPKERFYTDKVEVDTRHIERGQSFVDSFYDEGCDHTRSYMLLDYDRIN